MQKHILSIFSLFISGIVAAQSPEDALRYSWNVQNGTARIQAIGGAMGSLGGDITATFMNPAGLGFYRTGDVVFTPHYSFGKTKASYLGRREDTSANKFALGTSGIVFGGSDGRSRRSTAVSLAINQTADFKSNFYYRGQNNQNSYSQTFLDEINNGNIKDPNRVAGDYEFGTSLAFNTFWIDTIGGSEPNYRFQSRAPIATGLLQQNSVYSTGGITEFALGVGTNVSDKLMLGGTIGIPVLRHERQTEFVEADASSNANNNFDYAVFKQGLTTKGAGINLKGGLIYKPQEYWRLGFAFHTPTFYTLTDRNTAEITTNTENYMGTQVQALEDVTGMSSEFKYIHMTPLKVMGSVSYVLREVQDVTKQKGFLTADIEYVPYGMSRYFADNENGFSDQATIDYLNSLNTAISNAYKGAFNFRAGGELKFTTFMVRAGAAYYGSPYKNINNEKGSRLNLSGGLGYRHKGFFIDATYVHSMTKDVNVAYRLQNAPYFNADLRNTTGKVLLTLGFKI
jgi:hypothetical protein